jgi:hypothetical protein
MSTLTDGGGVELQLLEAPRYRRGPVLKAFAAELRRQRASPDDAVTLLLRLADRSGAELPWLCRPVEPCAGAAGRVAGADGPYLEGLVGALARLLAGLPETWFTLEGHGLEVRVAGLALSVEKAGG